jgi:hypothetical protein
MNDQNFKENVLKCLTKSNQSEHETYNEAFNLYRQSQNKDHNQERVYNLGFTPMNLKNLLYDLQKVNDISDLEIAKARMHVVKEVNEIEVNQAEVVGAKSTSTEPTEASTELTGDGTGVIAPEFKQESQETFKASPDEQERAILRNDFPFLSDKNCPDELKVLVADKITAFQKYTQAHAKLIKHSNGELELTEEELKEVSKDSVENFEANRDIFKELDYYKAHGKILGDHPIFKELTLQREVDAMTNEECVKYLNSSKKFISVKTKDIAELATAKTKGYKDKMVALNADIAARQEKVALVKKKLNFNE